MFVYISGNAGCGMWVMGGQPLIRMNQIYNNNDTGVSFIHNKVHQELLMYVLWSQLRYIKSY